MQTNHFLCANEIIMRVEQPIVEGKMKSGSGDIRGDDSDDHTVVRSDVV